MIIKKFQGKTEEEATAAAKKELGENVVVMNVKKTKRKGFLSFLRKPVIEVTVGMEEETEKPVMRTRGTIAPSPDIIPEPKVDLYAKGDIDTSVKNSELSSKLDSLQSLLEKKLTGDNSEGKSDIDESEDDSSMAFMKLIYNTLIDNEVAEKYANELIDEVSKINTPGASIDLLLANIYQKMILKFGTPVTIPINLEKQRVIFFIGPTGVGKTTTIAKLASQLSVNHKKKVALLTTDTYRIAAAEQLRTYANILEVPFRVIYTEEEMMTAINDFAEYDYVLVDTAGHSHHNDSQKDAMALFLKSVDETVDKDVYLVVSATTKYRDLLSIADSYSEFTDFKLIFTKLDETTTFGNLFNLCMHTGASMSYITCGQNVPDDIAVFSPQSTVKQLLGGK